MPSPSDLSHPAVRNSELGLRGTVPLGLSGRMVGIGGDGVLHTVLLADGQGTYSGRHFRTDHPVHSLVVVEGTLLAVGDDSPAYELRPDGDSSRVVDLAGHGRSLTGNPKQDPETGELHLITHEAAGPQDYVVVSAGALTRHIRPLLDAPARIEDLALSRDHAVLFADGFVGVAPRTGDDRTTWITTGGPAGHPVHAHEVEDTVVVLVLSPLLERWTLHPRTGKLRRDVLDPTPRRFAHCGNRGPDGTLSCLFTSGNGTVGHHDLAGGHHLHRSLRPGVPGDLVFVADATRDGDADGGWLVGFVHGASDAGTELHLIDASDIVGPAIATARIPRRIPGGLRCTWIPSTRQ